MEGTKISFLKAILCEEKKAFKNKEIKLIEIPNYHEISVTILYEDAIKDEEVVVYLPTKILFNKLPERSFFFGVLGTIKLEYLREIIEEAHKKRYSISPEDQKNQCIIISSAWLEELKKHHYYFSRKSVTGIYLMKEHAKVCRDKNSKQFINFKRDFYKDIQKPEYMNINAGDGTKRRILGPVKPQEEKDEKPNPFKGLFNM